MKRQQRSHQFCFSGATFRKSTRTPHCCEFLPYPVPQKLHSYTRPARPPGGRAPSHSVGHNAGRPRSCLRESLPRPPAEHCTRFRQGCSPAPPLYPFTGGERYTALDRSFLEERDAVKAALGHLSRASFSLHCRERGFLPSSSECSGSDTPPGAKRLRGSFPPLAPALRRTTLTM